ncbi:uncharacterized protein [Dermacentor albipictus]|uniref:uncharacterized protein isoform X3 n=1 Tax=Dermacentor albipictus TaxID=60249 RepID=UPI0038FC2CFF
MAKSPSVLASSEASPSETEGVAPGSTAAQENPTAQPAQTSGPSGDDGSSPDDEQASSTDALPAAAEVEEPRAEQLDEERTVPGLVVLLAVIFAVLAVGLVAVAFTLYILTSNVPEVTPAKGSTLAKDSTPAERPPPTEPPIVNPLICTFNIFKFTTQSVLPSDGTCDMIFLDSLFRDNKNGISKVPSGVVEEFLIVADNSRKKKQKTKMGLAFDSHSAGYQSLTSGKDWVDFLKAMWNKYKCSYYGALDGNIRAFNSLDKAEAVWTPLTFLRMELVKIAGAKDHYAVVLGVTSTDMDPFVKKVADHLKNVNGPTHFVIISHTSYSSFALPPYNKTAAHRNCYILPPLMYAFQDAFNWTFFSTMADSSKFLGYLRNTSVNVMIFIAVSVTLKGRWFTANAYSAHNPKLLDGCDDLDKVEDMPPYSVCQAQGTGLSTYKNSPNYKSVFLVNSSKVFTFEAESTLREKICDFKDGLKTAEFGLAVYDIDADSEAKPCPEVLYTGQYKRLTLLQNIHDFMENFTNVAECKLVT